MKHNYVKIILLCLCLFVGQSAFADAVEIDGIYYNLVSSIKSAEVTKKPSGKYSGSINIPETITYNGDGQTYTVTSIGYSAFSGCSGLTSITIPNSVTSIGEWAFSGCSGLTSITIPNSVTSIEERAFSDCSGLTSITIPNSVTSIGVWAFIGCSGLTSITIPNSVTSIGRNAFSGCSGLTSITIPNSVTSIGESAFSFCSRLTSITIPNSVTSIGSDAFYDCSRLTSITIPNSVTSIGERAFYNCSGLTKAEFASIESLCSISFDNYASNPLYYAHHLYIDGKEVKDLVIPNSVTSIGKCAFSGCSGLTSITIPNSVTSIGEWAFTVCSGLTKAEFASIESLCSISFAGEYSNPLYYAPHLYIDGKEVKDLVIPNSVTSIGSGVFYGCSGLTSITIPNSVTSIGERAFQGCSGLTSITIPNSVTSIGERAFQGCSGLTSITIPNSVTSIELAAFSGCSGLTSITIPNSVTSIGDAAFSGCSGLTSITIPNSVTSIGAWAFSGCTSLTSITIPEGVTSIGGYAFDGCTSLTTIIIPESVTSIGNDAFTNTPWYNDQEGLVYVGSVAYRYKGNMPNGTEITIKEGTTMLGASLFSGCSGLVSIKIPSTLKRVGTGAFYGCSSLEKVIVPDIAAWCGIIYEGTDFNGDFPLGRALHLYSDENTEITEVVIPEGVTRIEPLAFRDAKYVTSVTIPSSVTYIAQEAFRGMHRLTSINLPNGITSIEDLTFHDCQALPSITIPNSVTSIGGSAFSGCSSLTSVTIGSDVTSIGGEAFRNCNSLQKVIVPDIAAWCGIYFGDNYYADSNPLYYAHHIYCDENTEIVDLVIPDGVTSISSYAFYNCSGLTSVTIPESVTSIGSDAFQGCFFTKDAFVNNSTLTSNNNWGAILYDGEETSDGLVIENGVVVKCRPWATSVTIPSSVTSVAERVFRDCSSLTSVTFHCKTIGSWFSGMTFIKDVIIGDEVTGIDNAAFSGCTGLTSITIPESVTSIGSSAFQRCFFTKDAFVNNSTLTSDNNWGATLYDGEETSDGLVIENSVVVKCRPWATSATIPNSMTSIWSDAFSGCTSLTSITIPEGVTSIGNNAFYGCSSLTSITIPESVTSIGSSAFYKCSSLTSVTIGSGVTSIGGSAFYDCSLADVYCYAEDPPRKGIGGYSVFSNNSSSATLHVPVGSIKSYKTSSLWRIFKSIIPIEGIDDYVYIDGIYYTCSEDNAEVCYVDNIYSGAVVILESVTYNGKTYSVTSISNSSFSGYTRLTSVTIPESVTSIGSSAFYNCSSLTSVTIPESVTTIGDDAFSGCTGLTSITIPESVTSIGSDAFSGCFFTKDAFVNNSTLTSDNNWGATLYDGEETSDGLVIENSVVVKCRPWATSVTIPESVTSIGNEAFSDCSLLKTVTLENNSIVSATRTKDTSMKTIFGEQVQTYIIGYNVTKIGKYAFYNCTFLTKVFIYEDVTAINSYAFSGCTSLSDVFCFAGNVPSATSTVFKDSPIASATLHVPGSSIDSYRAHSIWGKFGNIVPLTDEEISDDIKDVESPAPALSKGEGVWYSLDGKRLDKPQKGLNIIRYSDGTTRKVMVK